jgi:hypothetical protein
MRTIRTPKKHHAFIHALAGGSSVRAACEAAGISKTAAFGWRRDDPDFAAAWDEAIEAGTETLEDEAVRRALAGSDTMLIFLLKARRPTVYRETLRLGGMADTAPIAIKAAVTGRVMIMIPDNGRGDRLMIEGDPITQ